MTLLRDLDEFLKIYGEEVRKVEKLNGLFVD